MHLPEVEKLVSELLGTGQMNEDTSADLHRMLAEARSNRLDADDLGYLRALHSRILSNRAERPGPGPSGSSRNADSDEIQKLRAQLASSNRIIAELRSGLTQANATIDDLRRQAGGTSTDTKFREIKKRFARKYHPNAMTYSGIEAMVRTELFKEFWAEFEQVERT